MSDDIPKDEFERRPELVKKRARAIIGQRIIIGVMAIYIVVSLGFLVTNAISSYQTRHTLMDCTTPEGDCYQHGQENQTDILRIVLDYVIATNACGSDPDNVGDFNKIKACVVATLAEKQKG